VTGGLQPALSLCHLNGLGPVAGTYLLHGCRQVVANRAGRQVQPVSDLADGVMPGGGGEHVGLAAGQRTLALGQGGGGEGGIDHALTLGDPPDRLG
jgi:hypothetical protein